MSEAVETPAPPPPASAPAPPSGFEEAFGAIDALGREEGTPAPPEPPPPGDARPRGPDGKFAKAPEKPAEQPPASTKEEDIDPSKLKTSELAKHYHKLKAEQKEWLKKQEDYEKRLKTPAEWPEKKTYEERVAAHEKEIESHKKRVEEYERELQFTNFTKSQLYKDTYEKPYFDSWATGQARAKSMKVIERRDADNNVIQQARQGTEKDFDEIMSISEDDLAAERAAELFGPHKASLILYHREHIRGLREKATAAIEEYQTKGVEREKVMREQREKESKEITASIEKFRTSAIEKYPALFKPDDSDPKTKELLDSGSHMLNRVLSGGVPLKDGDQQWTGEQMAIAVAAMRNKAAAFDHVNYKRHKAEKRVKELEKELAQYKASSPGNGDGKGREAAPAEKDPLQMIAALGRDR